MDRRHAGTDTRREEKLVAATISISVEACLKNHCFKQGVNSFLQGYSGVIGLDLMRCVALIYMKRWVVKFKTKLQGLNNKPILNVNDEAEATASSILEDILKEVHKQTEITQPPTSPNHIQTPPQDTLYLNRATNRTWNQQKLTEYWTKTSKIHPNRKDAKLAKLKILSTLADRKLKRHPSYKTGHTKWLPTSKDHTNKATITKQRNDTRTLEPPEINLVPWLLTLYVDDQFVHGEETTPGLRYNKNTDTLEMSTEQYVEDKKVAGDERSIRLLASIGNSIDPDIQLTYDAPSMNTNGKMALLDTEVWLEQPSQTHARGKIMFSHYRKPMASSLTVQANSALPLKQKITIMTQEIFRIKRNTHPDATTETWKHHCSEYMQRMKNSGWPAPIRKRVLKAGLVGWKKTLEKEINDGKPRYRHYTYDREARDKTKKTNRTAGLDQKDNNPTPTDWMEY